MTKTRILETVLYADGLDAAEAFYRDVLGLEVYSRILGRHVFFRCDQQMLLIFAPDQTAKGPSPGALAIPPHGARGPGHVCFGVSAEEIESWRTRLRTSGVAIEAEVAWPSGGRSVYFRDPAGNSLEFAEPKIWNLD